MNWWRICGNYCGERGLWAVFISSRYLSSAPDDSKKIKAVSFGMCEFVCACVSSVNVLSTTLHKCGAVAERRSVVDGRVEAGVVPFFANEAMSILLSPSSVIRFMSFGKQS